MPRALAALGAVTLTALALAFGLSGGSRAPATAAPQAHAAAADRQPDRKTVKLRYAGEHRRYRLFAPARVDAHGRVPLVVMTHGYGATAKHEEKRSGFDQLATRDGFVVVYPKALEQDGDRSWNAGSCCGTAVQDGRDDVGFIRAVVRDVRDRYRIDHDRTYFAGFSNGGMLGYRIACEHPRRFDAIAVVSGSRVVTSCTPLRSLALLHVHGGADRRVPVSGSAYSSSLASPLLGVADSVAPFIAIGADVRVEIVRGLGHAWTRNKAKYGIDESRYVWDWLARH